MCDESTLSQALCWPGFIAPTKGIPEEAGVCFEVCLIRERLLNGDRCTGILRSGFYETFHQRYYHGDDGSNEESTLPDVDSKDLLWLDAETEQYEKYLNSLDPKQWKDQDHYKVLGLSTLRWAASDDQIRLAYRKKVLKHHPDKRRHRGLVVKTGEEDYFTCITRSYETLSNSQKRIAYDSIDPTFDDNIPPVLKDRSAFFTTFAPAFERNERWSRVQPVPKLGDPDTPYEEVDDFYRFWYNRYDSWREFSYLDEEDKEKGENRDERRWIDKQNKAERERRRRDELRRIRNLIENSEKSDPRVLQYKENEKIRKEEEKKSREEAKRKKVEEQIRLKREEEEKAEREKQAQEELIRIQKQAEKRERDAKKKELQKERRILQEFCKAKDYFVDSDLERMVIMSDMDRLCQLLETVQLKELNEELAKADGCVACREILSNYVNALNRKIDTTSIDTSRSKQAKANDENGVHTTWTHEEMQLLVKAMTVFPVGTKSRWDVVAAFVNEHVKPKDPSSQTAAVRPKTAKDIIKQVKQLGQLDDKSKEVAVAGQALKQSKQAAQVDAPPSTRIVAPAELTSTADDNSRPWTVEEQKIFEQALRSYGADLGAERWEKVAGCLPNRTKKECIKRFKELAELVRAKKAALQNVEEKQKRQQK